MCAAHNKFVVIQRSALIRRRRRHHRHHCRGSIVVCQRHCQRSRRRQQRVVERAVEVRQSWQRNVALTRHSLRRPIILGAFIYQNSMNKVRIVKVKFCFFTK